MTKRKTKTPAGKILLVEMLGISYNWFTKYEAHKKGHKDFISNESVRPSVRLTIKLRSALEFAATHVRYYKSSFKDYFSALICNYTCSDSEVMFERVFVRYIFELCQP